MVIYSYTHLNFLTNFTGDNGKHVTIIVGKSSEKIESYNDGTCVYLNVMDKELTKERAVELLEMVDDNVTIKKIKE